MLSSHLPAVFSTDASPISIVHLYAHSKVFQILHSLLCGTSARPPTETQVHPGHRGVGQNRSMSASLTYIFFSCGTAAASGTLSNCSGSASAPDPVRCPILGNHVPWESFQTCPHVQRPRFFWALSSLPLRAKCLLEPSTAALRFVHDDQDSVPRSSSAQTRTLRLPRRCRHRDSHHDQTGTQDVSNSCQFVPILLVVRLVTVCVC